MKTLTEQDSHRRALRLLRKVLGDRRHLVRVATALFAPDVERAEILATVDAAQELAFRRRRPEIAPTPTDEPEPESTAPPEPGPAMAEILVPKIRQVLERDPEARAPQVHRIVEAWWGRPLGVSHSHVENLVREARADLGITVPPGPRKRRTA